MDRARVPRWASVLRPDKSAASKRPRRVIGPAAPEPKATAAGVLGLVGILLSALGLVLVVHWANSVDSILNASQHPKAGTLGSPIRTGDWEITVKSVTDPDTSSTIFTVPIGSHRVAVPVAFTNRGQSVKSSTPDIFVHL